MRIFACGNCGNVVFFENTICSHCHAPQGYHRASRSMVALDGTVFSGDDGDWHLCQNTIWNCNWLVEPDAEAGICFSCRLTRRRPDNSDTIALEQMAEASFAKRRLLFQLDELELPITTYRERPDGGLAFDLVSSTSGERVMTGHMNGTITVDLSEVSDPHREALRVALNEAYRTMLGHFRHEIGHYYWQVLVWEAGKVEDFRRLFGDERADYAAALDRHYREGSPENWQESYLSHYATTHPWEDFAESFAHYLHIRDALQTGASFGMVLDGPPVGFDERVRKAMRSAPRLDVTGYSIVDLITAGRPLVVAANELNRSMGQGDVYPFIITKPVVDKLAYVHELVTQGR